MGSLYQLVHPVEQRAAGGRALREVLVKAREERTSKRVAHLSAGIGELSADTMAPVLERIIRARVAGR